MRGKRYWIGGGSGSGKSTIACSLAAQYGLRLYDTDAVMSAHAHRLAPQQAPYLAAFMAASMDERWVERSPEVMLETFHWFRGEGFELIAEDLEAEEGDVLVEGFRLLPHLTPADRSVWLLPTPEFRLRAFTERGTLWEIPNRTSDPERALSNLLERDRLFTEQLRLAVEELGLASIHVDGTTSRADLADQVAKALRLGRAL
jgi:hypothetical protein